MILLHHFLVHVLEGHIPPAVCRMLYTLLAGGVNLFFMISGYWKIRFSLASILKLAITVLLFSCVNFAASYLCGEPVTFLHFCRELFFPISSSFYWFVAVYLMMIVTAPLVNAGLEAMDRKRLWAFMLVFTFFTIYSCGFGTNRSNGDGYSYLQGVYMYCLAHLVRTEHERFRKLDARRCLLWFLAICAAGGAAYVVAGRFGIGESYFRHYNNIFLIVGCAILFVGFSRLKISSRVINTIAAASLGCYLLQDGFFGHHVFYGWLTGIAVGEMTVVAKISVFTAVFFGTWICSLILSPLIARAAASLSRIITEKLLPRRIVEVFSKVTRKTAC